MYLVPRMPEQKESDGPNDYYSQSNDNQLQVIAIQVLNISNLYAQLEKRMRVQWFQSEDNIYLLQEPRIHDPNVLSSLQQHSSCCASLHTSGLRMKDPNI